MSGILSLPFDFLKFWYLDAPLNLLRYFASLNKAYFTFFSVSLFLKTFFKPIKNEYRQGLVRFSIGMGMVVKTLMILFSLFLFVFLLAFETIFFLLFIVFPIGTLVMLFYYP